MIVDQNKGSCLLSTVGTRIKQMQLVLPSLLIRLIEKGVDRGLFELSGSGGTARVSLLKDPATTSSVAAPVASAAVSAASAASALSAHVAPPVATRVAPAAPVASVASCTGCFWSCACRKWRFSGCCVSCCGRFSPRIYWCSTKSACSGSVSIECSSVVLFKL